MAQWRKFVVKKRKVVPLAFYGTNFHISYIWQWYDTLYPKALIMHCGKKWLGSLHSKERTGWREKKLKQICQFSCVGVRKIEAGKNIVHQGWWKIDGSLSSLHRIENSYTHRFPILAERGNTRRVFSRAFFFSFGPSKKYIEEKYCVVRSVLLWCPITAWSPRELFGRLEWMVCHGERSW